VRGCTRLWLRGVCTKRWGVSERKEGEAIEDKSFTVVSNSLQLCRTVEEPHALYHVGEVIGSDGRRRRVIRAMQSMYRPGSFDRVYREMKKMGKSHVD